MPCVALLALAFQVLGLGMAAAALVFEWLAKTPVEPRSPDPTREAHNPWATSSDRIFNIDEVVRRAKFQERAHSMGGVSMQTPADFVGAGLTRVQKVFDHYREAAAAEWQRQVDADLALRRDLIESAQVQSQAWADAHEATRRRIRWEMTGLGLALVGTVLGALAVR